MATIKTLCNNDSLATEGWFLDPQYRVPTGKKAIIKEIILCNIDTEPHIVTVQIAPTGGVGTEDCVFKDLIIDAKQTIQQKVNIVMESDDELWAFADDFSVVSFRLSGRET